MLKQMLALTTLIESDTVQQQENDTTAKVAFPVSVKLFHPLKFTKL